MHNTQKGKYLEIVKDFVNRDKITVLIRYNNIPLKLVYASKQQIIMSPAIVKSIYVANKSKS